MTLPPWFLRTMAAYAQGAVGFEVAYAVTEEAGRHVNHIHAWKGVTPDARVQGRSQALSAWRLLMDAHTERLARPVGAPTSEPRIRRGRLSVVVARIALGADPAVAEAEESCR